MLKRHLCCARCCSYKLLDSRTRSIRPPRGWSRARAMGATLPDRARTGLARYQLGRGAAATGGVAWFRRTRGACSRRRHLRRDARLRAGQAFAKKCGVLARGCDGSADRCHRGEFPVRLMSCLAVSVAVSRLPEAAPELAGGASRWSHGAHPDCLCGAPSALPECECRARAPDQRQRVARLMRRCLGRGRHGRRRHVATRTRTARRQCRSLARASISNSSVSRGRVGHFDTGAKIGFAVGAVTGALLACPPGNCDLSSGSWGRLQMIAGAFVLGAAGVLTGGVVGASYKTDRWEPLLPGRWRVNPLPTGPRDFGLILSLRW